MASLTTPTRRTEKGFPARQFSWSICFVCIALGINILISVLLFIMPPVYRTPEFTMGVVIALIVSVLLTLLYIIATGFAALNLNDKNQALGLPDGSVRALIALILIVMWIGLSVYLFQEASKLTDAQKSAQQLAQQLVTTLGTLVAAVTSFYFGTSSTKTRSSTHRADSNHAPQIGGVGTPSLAARVDQRLELTGESLETVRIVRLRRRAASGATETRDGTKIMTSSTGLTATFDLSNAGGGEPWDVYVETDDGESDMSNRAITVT